MSKRILVDGTLQAMSDTVKRFYPDGFPECKPKRKMSYHGMEDTPLYRRWRKMKERCYCKNNDSFRNYGGRGIIVCDEWKNNAKAFLDWALLNGYKQGLDIDRIDNNGNYEPSNCRFVTRRTNLGNIRKKSNLPTGVKLHGKVFQAQIKVNRKHCYLGTFKTPEEAGMAYQAYVKTLPKAKVKNPWIEIYKWRDTYIGKPLMMSAWVEMVDMIKRLSRDVYVWEKDRLAAYTRGR